MSANITKYLTSTISDLFKPADSTAVVNGTEVGNLLLSEGTLRNLRLKKQQIFRMTSESIQPSSSSTSITASMSANNTITALRDGNDTIPVVFRNVTSTLFNKYRSGSMENNNFSDSDVSMGVKDVTQSVTSMNGSNDSESSLLIQSLSQLENTASQLTEDNFITLPSMTSSFVTSSNTSYSVTSPSISSLVTSQSASSYWTSSMSAVISRWTDPPPAAVSSEGGFNVHGSASLINAPSFDVGGVRHEYLLGGIIIVTLVFLLLILMVAVSCTVVGHRRLDSYLSIPASAEAEDGSVVGGSAVTRGVGPYQQRPPYDYIYRPLRGCYSSGYGYADDGDYDDTFVGVSIPLLQDVTVV